MHIRDAMVHLLLKQPFYGYIAASVTPVESKDVPAMCITSEPALKLLYNKSWYEALDDNHALGAVMHEVLHFALLHPCRKGGRDGCLWSVACDMAVNEHIDAAFLPDGSVTVAKIAEEIKIAIPPKKSAEFYYDIISENSEDLSFIQRKDEISVILKSGRELKVNDSADMDSSEINRKALECTVSEILEQAASEDEIPNGLKDSIIEIYKTYEVNWRNVIKRFLSGKGKVLSRKSCKTVSRRFENLPGNKRTVGVNALLALDESGSISNDQVIKFYRELLAIKRITGACISVTQFDTECTDPVPIDRFTRNMERIRNGGTDFRPVFQLADKMHIPLLVIFTDGDGTAPEHSSQKVLWVLTKGGVKPAEYGHSVIFGA